MTDGSLDEKRVYAGGSGGTSAYVASEAGLARVEVAGDRVGRFGLVWRGDARDVAAVGGRVAVATAADVLVGTGDGFVETGFGPATAVGGDAGLVAAGDGRIARWEGPDDTGWTDVGTVDDVRAVDGDLLAAAAGVYRLDGTHVGLDDARDVAAAGPLAATADGVYRLGNGWIRDLPGDARAVAVGPDGSAHAATVEGFAARSAEGTWNRVDVQVDDRVTAIAYGEAVYAVTGSGAFLVDAGDGWRDRSLGLSGARGLAVDGRGGRER